MASAHCGIWVRLALSLTLQKRVCDEFLKDGMQKFFASAQCTGYNLERKLTADMCYPSKKVIIDQVKTAVRKLKVKTVFVGTDHDGMVAELIKALKKYKVSVYRRNPVNEDDDPIVDIALMFKADYFIGNCISTFSAFVRRQRQVHNKPIEFFGLSHK